MVIEAAARARIDAEIAKYPAKRGALLPALHIVHEQLGHVAPETARALAEIFEIRPGLWLLVPHAGRADART